MHNRLKKNRLTGGTGVALSGGCHASGEGGHGQLETKRGIMKRRTAGFTLIELLIVMVVIAILVAVVIPLLKGTKERAFVASMRSDLRNLETAQEAYFSDWQAYTSTLASLTFRASPNVAVTIDSGTATGWGANATHSATSDVCTIAVSRQHAGTPTCP